MRTDTVTHPQERSGTTLFAWTTPNSRRVAIALQELGIPHRVRLLDMPTGEHKQAGFLAINDQGMTPALWRDGARLRQSGAILLHLAETEGRLLARSGPQRQAALEWLLHSVADTQATSAALFFCEAKVAPAHEPTVALFRRRLSHFFAQADRALRDAPWLAGEYSIADISLFPVVAPRMAAIEGELPHLSDWARRIAARPAVQRGMRLESLS